ncbi:MAG: S26 family signal peptidase [Halobacteriales archaeon]|nr:S26 family signal peptidase [Halobacteriales archaeon]
MARDGWLKAKAPRLHRFWTRQDKPLPLLREALVGVLLIALLLTTLFAATAQPFPRGSPVVVVTSGSMMHCTNGHPPLGRDCTPISYGRIGTIDPGDLIFVRRVSAAGDVATKAQDRARHYGDAGDVVVYHRGGSTTATPIIHRALFYLTVNPDGTYTVAELGLDHVPSLDQPAVVRLAGCTLAAQGSHAWGAADSGFITRGDNNPAADQCPGISLSGPARTEWLLGKARGELPWVGLVKLFVDDLRGPSSNFGAAGTDSKVMLLVGVGVLVALPYGVRAVRRRRGPRDPAPPQP